MAFRMRQEKRLHMGGVGPRLLALVGHKGKRLHKGGVGPEMRSLVGFMGARLHATRTSVKVDSACWEQRR